MHRLTIGGVPEHFNLPWLLAIEEGRFEAVGIDLRWVDCPGGTGQMTRRLADGELDLALPLTEGAVAAITRGVPMRLLQWYVLSPLIWGVHVPARSSVVSVDQLQGHRFAISRPGSGSHLMAYLLARKLNWNLEKDLRFIEVKDLTGAIDHFSREAAYGFLWERFTTQPYVDQGLMRRVGDLPTPWPAFVLTARERVLARDLEVLPLLMQVINRTCAMFKSRHGIVELIAQRYGLELAQASEWFQITSWSTVNQVSRRQLEGVIEALAPLGVLGRVVTPEACCAPLCRLDD